MWNNNERSNIHIFEVSGESVGLKKYSRGNGLKKKLLKFGLRHKTSRIWAIPRLTKSDKKYRDGTDYKFQKQNITVNPTDIKEIKGYYEHSLYK